ncbi:Hypothetical predicted protein, partial [Marmota monax]
MAALPGCQEDFLWAGTLKPGLEGGEVNYCGGVGKGEPPSLHNRRAELGGRKG